MSGAWFWLLVPLAPLLAGLALAVWRDRAIGWLWLACIPALALVIRPMSLSRSGMRIRSSR